MHEEQLLVRGEKNGLWLQVNRIVCYSMPRNSVARLTDCPEMTMAFLTLINNTVTTAFNYIK